jgi:hypothetical protein
VGKLATVVVLTTKPSTSIGGGSSQDNMYEFKTDDGKKAYKFLLDEYLQMDTIGHISSTLVEKIVDNVTNVSYRNTSSNIEELTNQRISKYREYRSFEEETSILRGILLYPMVNKDLDLTYTMENHVLKVCTVNLNMKWQNIKARLIEIVA